MNQPARYFKQNSYLLVIIMWLLAEILWFSIFGLQFKMEAVKYIGEADYLLENHAFSQGRYLFYLLTILIIAAASALNIGVYGALLIIALINLCAFLYFFKALKKVFAGTTPALLIIAFLLAFWPYQIWSLFLYTECLFYSLVMILFSRLLMFERLDFKFLAGTFFILLLVILTRPLGVLFVFPVMLFLYFHLNRRQKIFFYVGTILCLIVLGWVVQVVFTTTHDWNMQRSFLEESIICDMPVNSENKNLDISQHPNQLYRLYYYISHNFSHFAGLALVRLKYFFLMTRNYYSNGHNLFLLLVMLPVYTSIVVGMKNLVRTFHFPVVVFCLSSILFFALAIAFQCDDYHNRFILTLMPLFAALAVAGCRPVLNRIFSFFSKQEKG